MDAASGAGAPVIAVLLVLLGIGALGMIGLFGNTSGGSAAALGGRWSLFLAVAMRSSCARSRRWSGGPLQAVLRDHRTPGAGEHAAQPPDARR